MPVSPLPRCAAIAVLALSLGATHALGQSSMTTYAHVSGGVSDDERAALRTQREHYTLWVATAARKSGAYLSDVEVTIADEGRRTVFDETLDGPWLLIALPPGRYDVQARIPGQLQHRIATIRAGEHREIYFYFDVDAEIRPFPYTP